MNSIISSLADYRASNLDINRTCEIPLQWLVCKDGELELVMLKEKICYNLSALIVENQKSSKNQKCVKCTCTEKILSTSWEEELICIGDGFYDIKYIPKVIKDSNSLF